MHQSTIKILINICFANNLKGNQGYNVFFIALDLKNNVNTTLLFFVGPLISFLKTATLHSLMPICSTVPNIGCSPNFMSLGVWPVRFLGCFEAVEVDKLVMVALVGGLLVVSGICIWPLKFALKRELSVNSAMVKSEVLQCFWFIEVPIMWIFLWVFI